MLSQNKVIGNTYAAGNSYLFRKPNLIIRIEFITTHTVGKISFYLQLQIKVPERLYPLRNTMVIEKLIKYLRSLESLDC